MDETGSFWTDPDAVAANASGRVTPAQYVLVAGRRPRGARVVAGVLVALSAVPVVLFVERLAEVVTVALTLLATGRHQRGEPLWEVPARPPGAGEEPDLIELGLVPILGLPILVGGLWSQRRDLRALDAALDGGQPMLRLETPVSVYTSDTLCQVFAQDVEFTVSAEMAAAFEKGRSYTLYYLPRPRQLLYAEPAVRDEPVDS